MSQASKVLRKVEGGFAHWCPGCKEMHILPEKWTFDGNLETPTFAPSFKHRGLRLVFANGEWTGEWIRDVKGNVIPYTCHYVLIAGVLNFCDDSTHALSGKSIPLPDLPGDLP